MRLTEIQIELAGVCNAACGYCTWQKRTKGRQLMEGALALRLLREAADLGVTTVRYHGLGESTLNPELPRVVELGEGLGLDHSLSTNCYTLRGDLAARLRTFPRLGLVLAVPWVMPERFVNAAVANALDFLAAPSANHRVHVQMVCDESARGHYQRFVEEFLPYAERQPNVYLHLKQPVTWPNDTPNKGFVDYELAHHPKVIHDTRPTPLSIGVGCNMPERFLMVLADGTCVPCCVGMTDWGLGSVVGRSLRDVWESPRMHEIRRLWRAADDSVPCGHCLKRSDCS